MPSHTVSRSAVCAVLASLVSLPFAGAQLTNPAAVVPSTNEARPAYNVPRRDAVYSTILLRISGTRGQTALGTTPFGSDARHHYSTDNPWSRTGLFYFMENRRGEGRCGNDSGRTCLADGACEAGGTCEGIPPPCPDCLPLILDGRTFAPHNAVPSAIRPYGGGPDTGLRDDDSWWDLQPGDREDMRIAIDAASGNVFKYSAVTGRLAGPGNDAIWQSGFDASAGGIATGVSEAQSWDGKLVVLARGDLKAIQLVQTVPGGTVGPAFDVFTLPSGPASIAEAMCGPGATGCPIDQVQVSASGRHVVVTYMGDYTRVLDVEPTTLALSPRDYTLSNPVPHVYAGCFDGDPDVTHSARALEHGFIFDLGHNSNGRNPYDGDADVVVGENHCAGLAGTSENGLLDIGRVIMVRLDDASVTSLTSSSSASPEAYATHVSMLAYQAAGYAFVTYSGDAPGTKFNEEIVRIKLSDGSVARFGRTHSTGNIEYRCEPHGVPAPDGQRVAFASCWTEFCGEPCTSNCDTHPPAECGWADFSNRQDYVLMPHVDAPPVLRRPPGSKGWARRKRPPVLPPDL